GDASLLSPMALAALEKSRAIFGYGRYIDLLPPELREGRRIASTGMTREIERCEAALDAALGGEECAVVCSGDPGIYAMAGLVYDLVEERGLSAADITVSVVPGIPALCAAAALLGAPLMHDFASISLSDLLTPWERIEKRLYHAFAGDFIVALYNPRSKGRQDHLARALELARAEREESTPVGIVRNAFREGQHVALSTLGTFDPEDADMLSIILIGNSATRILPAPGDNPFAWERGARMCTPRGYMEKYRKGAAV
ncbi:precorrin-3B C(17)-methyltransferase, partial [Desulfovibrio sp. OttesenSCG-928-I05]|nr:precorrin-3B C(17)-methyltransferase [Desulfovibrio sp. OttesenSCG-928-I05]